jgi:UDP-glucose/iron transport system permease protein
MTVEPSAGLAIAIVVLTALGVGAATVGRVPLRAAMPMAVVRAAAQLSVAALVITVALEHLALAVAVVACMYAVAVLTAARRSGAGVTWPWQALAIAAGWLPVLAVIFASGVVDLQPETLIPFGGIVVGGTMTAVSQATRRACHALRDGLPQYEAALALGLLPREAAAELTGRFTAESLFPALDQTRTVGVVTLPGAFIGVLLGGGSPAEAAAAQIVVLVGLLAAETIGVVVATRLVDRGRLLDAELRAHRILWD